jgi:hypothetical protein
MLIKYTYLISSHSYNRCCVLMNKSVCRRKKTGSKGQLVSCHHSPIITPFSTYNSKIGNIRRLDRKKMLRNIVKNDNFDVVISISHELTFSSLSHQVYLVTVITSTYDLKKRPNLSVQTKIHHHELTMIHLQLWPWARAAPPQAEKSLIAGGLIMKISNCVATRKSLWELVSLTLGCKQATRSLIW